MSEHLKMDDILSHENLQMLLEVSPLLKGGYTNRVVSPTIAMPDIPENKLMDFSSLANVLDEMCKRPYWDSYNKTNFQAIIPKPICPLGSDLLDGNLYKGQAILKDSAKKYKDFTLGSSKWLIDTNEIFPNTINKFSKTHLNALGYIENQTSLLAKNQGVSNITSAALQISSITGVLAEYSTPIRELIAPSTMMKEFQSLTTSTYKSFNNTGVISEWGLGLVDTASYLVDRHVNWLSGLCGSVNDKISLLQLSDWELIEPKVNFISQLSVKLENEKAKKSDISLNEALRNTSLLDLLEKGKRLISKVVDLNDFCERIGLTAMFKYTGGMMKASATIGGTCCSSKDTFGKLIDCLYMIFYENLSRIKIYVSDEDVRQEDVFQCVFRIKDIRTDYRHDYEHGSDSEIKKKQMKIGRAYNHYSGKPVLFSDEDFQNAQDKIYDEFDSLVDYLQHVIESSIC